jgi:hypothetical protein
LLPAPAAAAGWATIEPGVSTTAHVRERFGAPSRERRDTLEGYDTLEWVYESGQAPVGMIRVVVGFGLLSGGRYQPDVVRVLRLQPKPHIFHRLAVLEGWGRPDRVGKRDGRDAFFYDEGLIVVFDEGGRDAATMVFAPAQPEPAPTPAEPQPPRPPASSPPPGTRP